MKEVHMYLTNMGQILCSDWALDARKRFLFGQNKSLINQACSVLDIEYWPASFFAFFSLNLANILPFDLKVGQ